MALMLWFGFIGGWLLVAGPLFQGVLELREQEINREEIEAATAGSKPGPRPSRWWWLVPPLMLAKIRRRDEDFWREALAALPADQVARIAGLRPKMYGWFIVSLAPRSWRRRKPGSWRFTTTGRCGPSWRSWRSSARSLC